MYAIQFDSTMLNTADIDECVEGSHQCAQICNNTIGSYTCSCNSGFIINVDGKTCDGGFHSIIATYKFLELHTANAKKVQEKGLASTCTRVCSAH